MWVWVACITIGSFLLTVIPRYWLVTAVGAGDHQKIQAAPKRQRETRSLDPLIDLLAKTVFRTDLPFLPSLRPFGAPEFLPGALA